MTCTIRYRRIGNAQPCYAVERDGETWLAITVDQVQSITGYRKRPVQMACKEAREDGVSDFLA